MGIGTRGDVAGTVEVNGTEPEVVRITSRDGTEIACHRSGTGPPLVLVHGTGGSGARWTELLPALTSRFTVYAMDRRGRGASGDTEPYAIEHEYEDIAAVVDGILEPVNLFGHSYGALCSLEAVVRTSNLRRLVLYEPALSTGIAMYEPGSLDRLDELLAAGDREGVLVTFMREIVQMSEEELELMRASTAWEARVAAAHTIPREFADAEYVFEPDRFRDLRVPTMLLMGEESPEVLRRPTHLLHRTLPDARLVVLEGQQHVAMDTAPDLFLRELIGFLDEPEPRFPGASDVKAWPCAATLRGSSIEGRKHMEPRALTHEIKGDGEPVVLVPGGLTGWLSWMPHAERLSARWRTIRVQPIHNELGSAGQSGVPGYTAETERESLRMTLDALGIEAAHFAGWSAGGKALIEFALSYPGRIRSLTLIEPGAYWILEQLGEANPDVERANAFIQALFGKDVTEDDLAAFLELAGLASSKTEARSDPYWDRAVPHRAALSWYSDDFDRSGRSIEELTNIRSPVLLVKGSVTTEGDKRVVDVLGERLPNATVLELSGDHGSHIQSIDAFLEAFEKHLAPA